MSSIPVIVVLISLGVPVCIFVYIRLKNSGVFHVSDWIGERERDFYYTVPEPTVNSVASNWKIDLDSIHHTTAPMQMHESVFGINSNVISLAMPPGWA